MPNPTFEEERGKSAAPLNYTLGVGRMLPLPSLILWDFLDDRRQVAFTYWIAALQMSLLVAAALLMKFTTSYLWLMLAFLAYWTCLAFQFLFLLRIVTHKFGDRFPPVGHAEMFNERSPVSEFGWLHATGGCLMSIVGSAIVILLAFIYAPGFA